MRARRRVRRRPVNETWKSPPKPPCFRRAYYHKRAPNGLRNRMSDVIAMRPIGVVRSTRSEPTDELDHQQFTADALCGIDAFSHVEILYVMHGVSDRRGSRACPARSSPFPRVWER